MATSIGFLRLESVSKSYDMKGQEVSVVKNLSLQIDQGKIFGIIGRSGAGKSTLLRLINLLEKPNSGEIFLEGEPLTLLSRKALREKRKKKHSPCFTDNKTKQKNANQENKTILEDVLVFVDKSP